MTKKIKEFKGSLNSIFTEDTQNITGMELEPPVLLDVLKNELLISLIKPREDQPRKNFNEASLAELAQSIKAQGVIQPIIVRMNNNGFYEIIAGERRWRAAKIAGLEKIPVVIRDYSLSDGLAVALIENIQRENLNPLEEAQAIQSLIDSCEMTHIQVAESLGKSRSAVSNLLRLLDLSDAVKIMVNSGQLEMGHARALLALDADRQIDAARVVVGNSLSVRETEKLVQRIHSSEEKSSMKMNPIFEKKTVLWKEYLSMKLSSKVSIQINHEGKGKVTLNFDSIEEGDCLMNHIGFNAKEEIDS